MRIRTDCFTLIISPLFFIVVTLLLTLSSDSTVIIALFSSVLHECGHLFALMHYGSEIKSVTLSFYGMKIIRENEMSLRFSKEIAVCLAGVTVNFILCFLFFFLHLFFDKTLLLKVFAVNLVLGVFNALPVYSLDGGRAVLCILKSRFEITKCERIMKIISALTLIPVLALSAFLLFNNGNFTLFLCSVYLLISSFFSE